VSPAGVPLTIPHYYDFGGERELVGDDLVRPDSWDALRTQTDGPFALGASREDWERRARQSPELERRASALADFLAARGVASVASYGCGIASLEYWLHEKQPGLALTVADYTPETVAHLAEFFPAADVRRHDMLREAPLAADLHVFHRIDTEFTNDQWRDILRRFAGEPVLVIASEVIRVREVLLELRKRFGPGHATQAGLVRNRAAFEQLWGAAHTPRHLQIADLEAWMLEPR
jgi:hypothetical protein